MDEQAKGFDRKASPLVSAEWLEDHLNDPEVRVLDGGLREWTAGELLALKLLGYECACLYDGSWAEWGSDENRHYR